jgi:hypothetical protein
MTGLPIGSVEVCGGGVVRIIPGGQPAQKAKGGETTCDEIFGVQ